MNSKRQTKTITITVKHEWTGETLETVDTVPARISGDVWQKAQWTANGYSRNTHKLLDVTEVLN